MWHCYMCGISLDDAVARLTNPLLQSVDKIVDNVGHENRWISQYKLNRVSKTKKKPKVTCSRVCGSNYVSHLRTLDPIHTYTNQMVSCPICHKSSEGGRQMVVAGKLAWICRPCHRKLIIKDAREMWEEVHRKEKREYSKAWNKKHRVKYRRYKRKSYYRTHRGKQLGAKHKNMWAYQYKSCIMCGTNAVKHKAHGFCRRCYTFLRIRGTFK